MTTTSKWIIGVLVGVMLLCLCIGAAVVLVGGLSFLTIRGSTTQPEVVDPPFPSIVTEQVITPDGFEATPEGQSGQSTPFPDQDTPQPVDEGAIQTLALLEDLVVPVNDPRDLALRLEGKQNIPETVPAPAQPVQVGDEQNFWVSNVRDPAAPSPAGAATSARRRPSRPARPAPRLASPATAGPRRRGPRRGASAPSRRRRWRPSRGPAPRGRGGR